MVIRGTETELELSGTRLELLAISTAIASLQPGQCCRFLSDQDADPNPYAFLLTAFEAVASTGLVRLQIVGGTLCSTGSVPMLARFASFFIFHESHLPGAHTHHEWWEGNESISPDSLPLVVTVASE